MNLESDRESSLFITLTVWVLEDVFIAIIENQAIAKLALKHLGA